MADEKQVIIRVSGDTAQIESSLDNVKSKLEGAAASGQRSFTSYKAAIREATVEAAQLERQFGKNSNEFRVAAQRVANLKDEFSDFNNTVQAFNPDNKFQSFIGVARGAANAVQGVAGAMTVLGADSDTAQVAIARLQGLMAFTDALGSVDDIKNSFKDFGSVIQSTTTFQKANSAATTVAANVTRLLGVSANQSSLGFKVLKGAIISTGIGALVVGLGLLIANFDNVKKVVLNLIPGLSGIASTIGNIIQGITDFIGVTSEADRAAERLKKNNDSKVDAYSRQIALLEAQGGQERQIYLLKQGQLDLQIASLKAQKDLTDEQKKELLDLQNQKNVLYTERIRKEKEANDKEVEENKKKNEKKIQDDNEAAKTKKQKREAEAKERKQFEDSFEQSRQQSTSNTEKIIQQNRLNSIKDEFTRKQQELANQEQTEIDSAVETFNKQEQLLKVALSKGLISRSEFNTKEQQAKIDLEAAKLAITENYSNQQNKLLEEKRKEDSEKALAEAQKNVDEKKTVAETTLIKTERTNKILDTDTPEQAKQKIDNITQARIDAENASFEADKVRLAGNQAELEKLEQQHQNRLVEINEQASKDKIDTDNKEKQARLNNLSILSSSIGQIGNLIGQQTVAGKALGVAQATIDTYVGANKAFAQAGIFGFVQAAAIIASGLANVKKIVSTKIPGKSDSSSLPSISAPVINSTQLNNQGPQDVRVVNQESRPARAYIVQRDLDENNERQDFLNKLGSI